MRNDCLPRWHTMRAPALLLTLAALAMTLCACADGDKVQSLQPVELPTTCARFHKPVEVPPVTADTDAHVAWNYGDAALATANERLIAGGACERDEREKYSRPEARQEK